MGSKRGVRRMKLAHSKVAENMKTRKRHRKSKIMASYGIFYLERGGLCQFCSLCFEEGASSSRRSIITTGFTRKLKWGEITPL